MSINPVPLPNHQLTGPEAATKLINLAWGGITHQKARYGVIAVPTRGDDGKLRFGSQADIFVPLASGEFAIDENMDKDVYFVPSVLKSQANRRRENCAGSQMVWLDYDRPTTLSDLLDSLPLPPTAVLQSSEGKFHVYWKLTEFIENVERVQCLNSQVLYNTPGAVDADASGYDATQLLRLPMGVNAKHDYDGEPYRPALVVLKPERVYEPGQFEFENLPPESSWRINKSDTLISGVGRATPLTELERFPDYAVREAARLLSEGPPSGMTRGKAVYQVVKTLQASDFDIDDVVSWIAASPLAGRYDGSEERMLTDIERIWDKHASTPGSSVSDRDSGDGATGVVDTEAVEDRVSAFLKRFYDSDRLDQIPDLDPLVDDVLSLNSVARAFGESGSGKSFVAVDLSGCVGTGMKWHGRQVTQGNVAYVVAEGEQGLRKRVRLWEQHFGRKMENVYVLPEPLQIRPDTQDWQDFADTMVSIRPKLIIFDTQARVTVGVDENNNTDFVPVIDALELLRKATGACVLLIHHVGAGDPRRARGNTGTRGALQTELLISRDKKTDILSVESLKQKDDEESEIKLMWTPKVLDGYFKRNGEPVKSVVLTDMFINLPNAGTRTRAEELAELIRSQAGSDSATWSQVKIMEYVKNELGERCGKATSVSIQHLLKDM